MYNRHKELPPAETIVKIRTILTQMGITTTEYWFDQLPGAYSVRIENILTKSGTNGKGSTPELALTSGLAEFMERLQNLYIDKLNYNIITESYTKCADDNFVFFPDEYAFDNMEFARKNPLITRIAEAINISMDELIIKLEKFEKKDWCNNKCYAIPYQSINDGEKILMPLRIQYELYGSNGMCAGNNKHEALVQGISEVFERFAVSQIYYKELTPPIINKKQLQNYPELIKTIDTIEADGRVMIELRDFSLGMNLPVVAVIAYNTDTGKYYVNAGSHPEFPVAVERCLTEFLQGKTLANIDDFMLPIDFSFNADSPNFEQNLTRIIHSGNGIYPSAFFTGTPSWEYKQFNDVSQKSNQQLLKDISELLSEQGFNTYYRDFSYLGFPTYKVIIPGMSDYSILKKEELKFTLNNHNTYYFTSQLASENITEDDKYNMFKLMAYNSHFKENPDIIDNINNNEIGVALAISLGDISTAKNLIFKYLLSFEKTGYKLFYKCLHEYLKLKVLNITLPKIKELLLKTFPVNTVNCILENWTDKEQILIQYQKIAASQNRQNNHIADAHRKAIAKYLRKKMLKYYTSD
jgi:ribosomal protein S12 methylthiotransferase accessory factor